MPSSTPKQANLMRAVAHGFKPDRIKDPPVSVAKDFEAADEGKLQKSGHAPKPNMKRQMAQADAIRGKGGGY